MKKEESNVLVKHHTVGEELDSLKAIE